MRNKKQFTLIELIIVIIVIGILAGMALPKFLGVQRNAKVAAMETDLDVIEKAVLQYITATDDGSYPFIDVNGDKIINEEDLYFKTTTIPQTLTDSLLKASGDDGSKIYKLDMEKLKPYISKIKYPDTEYLYSEKSDTAIDPIGKADGDNFIHHIIGSGNVDSDSNKEKTISMVRNENFFIGPYLSAYVGEDGEIYGNGNLYDEDFSAKPWITQKKLTINANAIKIFSTWNVLSYIDKDGKVFTFGDNGSGQLGRATSEYLDYNFKEAKLPNGVKAIDIGQSTTFTIVVGDDGNLYCTGSNRFVEDLYKQGKYTLSEFSKFSLPNGKKAKEIVSSDNHILVLDTEGNIHISGSSGAGYYIGIKNPCEFKSFTFENPIVGISTGHDNMIVVDNKGNLYGAGLNSQGELGLGDKVKRTEFEKIPLDEGIIPKNIESFSDAVIMLSTDGDLYGWGGNGYSRFGEDRPYNVLNPVKLEYDGIGKVKTLYASYNYGCQSFAFEDMEGNVYGLGSNSSGMLAIEGDDSISKTPLKADLTVKIKR